MPFLEWMPHLNADLAALVRSCAILGTAGAVLGIALCGPLAVLGKEAAFSAGRKAFWDKASLQTAQAAFIFVLFLCGALSLLVLSGPASAPWSALPPALTGLCAFLYLLPPVHRKNLRPLRVLLSAVSAAGALTLLAALLALLSSPQIEHPADLAGQNFFSAARELSRSTSSAGSFVFALASGLAATEGVYAVWLILRRNKADYGRDYYAFAMRRAAASAAVCAGLGAAVAAARLYFIYQSTEPASLTQSLNAGLAAAAFVLPALCVLLWGSVAASGNPMRRKAGAVAALPLFVAGLGAQTVCIVQALPMP